jgi:hypothetical protein
VNNPLKDLDVDRWYLVLLVLSMLELIASIFAKERIYTGLCFGMLLFGMGELINHPMRQMIVPRGIITSHTRRWTFIGTVFDIAGVLVTAWFAYRLAITA